MKGYKLHKDILIEQQTEFRDIAVKWFTAATFEQKLYLVLTSKIVELQENKLDCNERRYKSLKTINPTWALLKHRRHWVYFRDNSVCAYCDVPLTKAQAQIDHVIPASSWPKKWLWLANDASNLVASCPSCNQAKNIKLILPSRPVLPIVFGLCMPQRLLTNYHCAEASDNNCESCGAEAINVFCIVHGEQTIPLCQNPDYFRVLGEHHGL